MDQESVATATQHRQEGEETPLPLGDALVHLRRQSDWTGRPRGQDAAAEAAYRAALDLATATLAAHDDGTASHSDDVTTLCIAIGEQLGVEGRECAYLLAAAELHDIGKVGIPAEVLTKPSGLAPREWDLMREHTITGERILGSVPELTEVARIVRHCHERWDGKGYPDGIAGEQIPLAARIVFCADAFHAIRDDRPYRPGRSARVALAEIRRNSSTQFDPAVVDALGTAALQVRDRRRHKLTLLMGRRRSQRLAALLLTLAIGTGAMAATGVWSPPGSARAEDSVQRGPLRQAPGSRATSARNASSTREARTAPARRLAPTSGRKPALRTAPLKRRPSAAPARARVEPLRAQPLPEARRSPATPVEDSAPIRAPARTQPTAPPRPAAPVPAPRPVAAPTPPPPPASPPRPDDPGRGKGLGHLKDVGKHLGHDD